ncbi:serine hydrolase domain-containing protein [Robiginitalea sp. IMCC44478]|uniref:serine hydrolase domain-containing protein n=1 Tax=Robiginitalea sp. IMCC44478 TaxID=3459122 RepID=UPI0040416D48
MKNLFFISVLVMTLFGCRDDIRQAHPEGTIPELSDYFEKSSIPAAVMGHVSQNGEVQWQSFGPAIWGGTDSISETHIFRIYSMTKAIASVAAMQLVETGKIGLDDPLDELMPEMAAIPILTESGELVSGKEPITLRQLLTHTAGFGYDFTSLRLQQFQPEDWEFEGKPRLFGAGTHWRYGTSTEWVGKLIEKISGKNLEAYLRQNITGPLQMDHTWFNVPDSLKDKIVSWGMKDSTGLRELPRVPEKKTTTYNAGGGLFGSPADYLKFLQCMLNYGAYEGGRILKKETVELMIQDHLPETIALNFEVFPNDVMTFTGNFGDTADRHGLAWAIEANKNEKVRPQGVVYWAGAANSYYTLDIPNQTAIVYFTQYLPFNDKETFDFYRLYEQQVYNSLASD